jgi:acyl carrier protein
MEQLNPKLVEIVVRRFKVDGKKLHANDDFYEKLGIDSLQAMDLLCEVELQFGVEIPNSRLKEAKTFGGLSKLIERPGK